VNSPPNSGRALDPRVRRTRVLLHDALLLLMRTRSFEQISVQDVTDEATVNRATFYAHYEDKSALLASATTAAFHQLIDERAISFDGTCESALRKMYLGVCDYLASAGTSECGRERPIDPHMAAAIVEVVRRMVLDSHPGSEVASISIDMIASTIAHAVYGAARSWLITPQRGPAEANAAAAAALISPLLHPSAGPKAVQM